MGSTEPEESGYRRDNWWGENAVDAEQSAADEHGTEWSTAAVLTEKAAQIADMVFRSAATPTCRVSIADPDKEATGLSDPSLTRTERGGRTIAALFG